MSQTKSPEQRKAIFANLRRLGVLLSEPRGDVSYNKSGMKLAMNLLDGIQPNKRGMAQKAFESFLNKQLARRLNTPTVIER